MTERWMPIPGYESSYEVSDLGRVRSFARTVPRADGKPLPVPARVMCDYQQGARGYRAVRLSHGTGSRNLLVHRLVLLAFVGPPSIDMQGCHNDGNPANNRLDNLRWDTASANMLDRVTHGTDPNARKTHCPQGHAYDEANTRIRPPGWRACRACVTAYRAAHRAGSPA